MAGWISSKLKVAETFLQQARLHYIPLPLFTIIFIIPPLSSLSCKIIRSISKLHLWERTRSPNLHPPPITTTATSSPRRSIPLPLSGTSSPKSLHRRLRRNRRRHSLHHHLLLRHLRFFLLLLIQQQQINRNPTPQIQPSLTGPSFSAPQIQSSLLHLLVRERSRGTIRNP